MSVVREGFGAKLRLLMLTQPETISEVARAVGLSEQVFRELLSSSDDLPRIDTVRRLAEFYGISLDYFHCNTLHECRIMLQNIQGKLER